MQFLSLEIPTSKRLERVVESTTAVCDARMNILMTSKVTQIAGMNVAPGTIRTSLMCFGMSGVLFISSSRRLSTLDILWPIKMFHSTGTVSLNTTLV